MKLLVINPFATDKYDAAIEMVCNRAKRSDTKIHVEHLDKGLPFIRHGYFKSLIVPEIVEKCILAEQSGFDGIFISCCFEPGVREAREVVDIPVVGGSAPPVFIARQLGHKFGFITDTEFANVLTYEVFKQNKLDMECVGIKAVEMGVEEIQKKPEHNQEHVINTARELVKQGADTIILGCTVVAAFFNYKNVPDDLTGVPIIDSNVAALNTLEMFAGLKSQSNIIVSRKIYPNPREIEPDAFDKIRQNLRINN